jgi:hypothetical protein
MLKRNSGLTKFAQLQAREGRDETSPSFAMRPMYQQDLLHPLLNRA